MKILVTGGLGFVGSNLVDKLVQDPDNEVTVYDNVSSESSFKSRMREDVTYIVDDIRNINSHYHTPDFDLVFHLAALARIQPSFRKPLEYIDVDAMGTAHVLEFARRCQNEVGDHVKVVYAGSSSFYGGPFLNPYAFAKHMGEDICKLYSSVYRLKTATARFFNVYGERQPTKGEYATVVGIFERQFISNESLTVTGDGSQKRDFTHISDIVRGLIAISKGDWFGEVFNLGTGKNYSINQLADMFGTTKRYLPGRPGEAQDTLADIQKTKDCTGWEPVVSLEDYVKKFVGLKNDKQC